MTSTTQPTAARAVLQLARAVVLTWTTFVCGAVAHTVAGGGLPHLAGAIVLMSSTFVVLSVVARWRLNPWTLVPTLAALQLVLHPGFRAFSGRGGAVAAPDGAGRVHAHHVAAADELVAMADAAAAIAQHGGGAVAHTSPQMLAAHALAVVVTTMLAVGADRALARTVAGTAVLLRALLRRLPPLRALARPSVPVARVEFLVTQRLLVARPRRGPPGVASTA